MNKPARNTLMLIVALVTLILLALTFTPRAQAADFKPTIVNEMVSTPGESKLAFVLRVTVFLQGYTYSTGAEACGMLSQSGDQYGVVIGTLGSQVQCDSLYIIKGFASLGETIHSHPTAGADNRIKLTDRTREVAGGTLAERRSVEVKRRQFSDDDYRMPGYLVADGLLLYQRGKGTREVIAIIPKPEF